MQEPRRVTGSLWPLWQMAKDSRARSKNLIPRLRLEQRGEGGGPCPLAGDGVSPSVER